MNLVATPRIYSNGYHRDETLGKCVTLPTRFGSAWRTIETLKGDPCQTDEHWVDDDDKLTFT